MKILNKTIFILGVSALCINTLSLTGCNSTVNSAATKQQEPPSVIKKLHELPNTEVFSFESKETGNTYNISVAFPGSYTQADESKTYPVVYVIDAQWQYPLMYTTYGAVNYDGEMPEAILVGVSWKETNGNLMQLRDQDLTPTTSARDPKSGHAKKFQAFFRNELFPHIENNYKGGKVRTVTGGSTSALFVFYTLISQPDLFTGYIGSSPSLYWDNHAIDKILADFPKNGIKQKTRAWLAWGSLELGDDSLAFAKKLAAKKIPNLEFGYAAVDNAGHASVNPECYTKGLQFVYAKPELKLPNKQLVPLVGTYKSKVDGEKIIFSMSKGNLFVQSPGDEKYRLSAASERDFYLKGNGLEYSFTSDDQNKPSILTQYFHGSPTEFMLQK
ncbi:MAG: alpha/beta hydrolase [Gammaproteobacteria bacterium]|nr:MAG: alpha/beta hydrolase [Gammaproteobacteria bacterium]